MSYISSRPAVAPLDLAGGSTSSTAGTSTDVSLATMVGSRWETSDGREYVLVQNAGTALVAGNLIQGPPQIANHQNLTTTAFTAATTSALATVTVTLGATLASTNQYQLGYAIVNAGTGIGQTLKISSHPSAAQSGSLKITLEDNPVVALDTTSKICLRLNPYGTQNGTDFRTSGVVICPTTLTGQVIGVTNYAIGATTAAGAITYGLIQTRGLTSCLNDATTAIGLDVMPSSNTAGAVMTYVAATSSRVGTSTQAGVTTEARQITVQL